MYSAGPTSNINEINKVLNVTSTCQRSDDNVMLFLGTHSPLSNLLSADLSIDNVKYNSSEQYIQSQKAMLFDDDVTHARIMKETNQYKIKKLGSKVLCGDMEISVGALCTRPSMLSFGRTRHCRIFSSAPVIRRLLRVLWIHAGQRPAPT